MIFMKFDSWETVKIYSKYLNIRSPKVRVALRENGKISYRYAQKIFSRSPIWRVVGFGAARGCEISA